ncbi:DUF4239 domain-containing protein [Actinosynnema sp. NPDC047251]|uniref:Uncharacterized protein n=1 Tax=Saccharothrix espanaensis (strain ATCC 51144 / DSM 44229 / JCM 9112 / NBRC 15066 / NRRL 15764) TaxID=1179773 RepID=K0JUW3_SACES|nr:DUF4239 domain-containing protein [Saccharothrix espanaensis]CCH29761.1 hypothetical protein BN6_24470 [Saccharothrix espanaensis DSM 44229]
MNVYTTGLLWVGGAAVFAAVIAYLIRKYGPDEGRSANNEAAGQVFTIVGGLHAVLVAFVLIALFDAVGAAGQSAYKEADGLVAATWAADALSAETGEEVRQLSRAYAITVINDEWPELAAGRDFESEGWNQLDRIRRVVAAAPAGDEWLMDRKKEAASQLWQVFQARQERLDAAGGGVSAVVWFVLVMGSVLSIGLPLLFGGPLMRTHVLIVATLAATITLLLYATYQLQNPYGGGAELAPDAFRLAVERFG